jgi:hypothetical protein
MDAAGISSEDGIGIVDMKPVLSCLLTLGRVPLVHAHEWNLTSKGPKFEMTFEDIPGPITERMGD